MKLFTLEEANSLLPSVRLIVKSIQKSHRRVASFNAKARHAAEGAESGGGGLPEGQQNAELLVDLSMHTEKIESLGVQIKDYGQGLIDFPSQREGPVALLCLQADEGDPLEWWPDTEAR